MTAPFPSAGLTRRQLLASAGAATAIAGTAAADAASPGQAFAATPGDPRFAPLYPVATATRTVRDLSGLWRFRLDPEGVGERERWFDGLAESRAIPVPCSWNDLFDDAAGYFGAGWYETSFPWEPGWAGRRMQLRFGSAVYRARAWLNGRLLGEHAGGHLPFAFDATATLRADGPNRLVVMVENRLLRERVPDVPDPAAHFYQEDWPQTAYDFFPYSGLHRPVWLQALPPVHIEDVRVTTRLAGGRGLVEVELAVTDGWSGEASLTLEGAGVPAIRQRLPVRGGRGRATLPVANPRLWRPGDPFLHSLTVRLGEGPVIDEYPLRVGIRTVEVRGAQLLLNGEPIHLRGFGRHEDFPIHGRGLDLAVTVRDYELLKWVGANSFRTSHYPDAEEALALADEAGLLVIGETPGVSLIFSDPAPLVEQRRRQLGADIADMIARDKNHPCIILWSIANEALTKPFHTTDAPPPDAVAKGTRFFADMFATARAADPTRPVAMVSVQGGPAEWVAQGDVVCANSYDGWYAVSGRVEDGARAARAELVALHAQCGNKPMIVTEFGADAMAGVHAEPPVMWSEEYQADLIAAYLDMLDALPFVVGTHPWTFADFRTAQSIMRVGSLNLKGVFTRDRRPKEAARMLRARWNGRQASGGPTSRSPVDG